MQHLRTILWESIRNCVSYAAVQVWPHQRLTRVKLWGKQMGNADGQMQHTTK